MALIGAIHYGEHSYNKDLTQASFNDDVTKVSAVQTSQIDTAWGGIWQYNYSANVPPPQFGEDGLVFTGARSLLSGQVASTTGISLIGLWFKPLSVSGTYGIVQIDSGSPRRAAIWQINTKFGVVFNNTPYQIDDWTLVAGTWYYVAVSLVSTFFYLNGVAASIGTPLGASSFSGSWLGGCYNGHAGSPCFGNCVISDVYIFNTVTATPQERTYRQQNYPIDLLAQPMNLRQSESRQFMQNSRGT